MEDKDKEIIEARKQYCQDVVLFETYLKEAKQGEVSKTIEMLLFKRAYEIVNKAQQCIIDAVNDPRLIIPELESVGDFPSDIFNYTDKLTLLNEGDASYEQPGDKKAVEDKLEEIIHFVFERLSSIEKDIINCASDLHKPVVGMPWYEWEVLDNLLTGVDYDDTMKKVDKYNEYGLWYQGQLLTYEDLRDVQKGGFSDIAGLEELKEQLQSDFIDVMKEPERAKKLGLSLPNGMLLYGPPGCGKTVFGIKLAEEAGCNFQYVNGSDLGSTYIHGTQLKIADVFKDAAEKAPTILFFDEIDAMIPNRGRVQWEATRTEINEFLTQLNHCGRKGIFVIGATNRPEDIDVAALRSGRLDMKIYFPTPDDETRASLFITYLKDKNIRGRVYVDELVEKTKGYISADIKKIVELTARKAFKEKLDYISMEMLNDIISTFKPTVSRETIKQHEAIRDRFENLSKERRPIGFC